LRIEDEAVAEITVFPLEPRILEALDLPQSI
jgi:hypothetical protein